MDAPQGTNDCGGMLGWQAGSTVLGLTRFQRQSITDSAS